MSSTVTAPSVATNAPSATSTSSQTSPLEAMIVQVQRFFTERVYISGLEPNKMAFWAMRGDAIIRCLTEKVISSSAVESFGAHAIADLRQELSTQTLDPTSTVSVCVIVFKDLEGKKVSVRVMQGRCTLEKYVYTSSAVDNSSLAEGRSEIERFYPKERKNHTFTDVVSRFLGLDR